MEVAVVEETLEELFEDFFILERQVYSDWSIPEIVASFNYFEKTKQE
jgi:hypothetical protein